MLELRAPALEAEESSASAGTVMGVMASVHTQALVATRSPSPALLNDVNSASSRPGSADATDPADPNGIGSGRGGGIGGEQRLGYEDSFVLSRELQHQEANEQAAAVAAAIEMYGLEQILRAASEGGDRGTDNGDGGNLEEGKDELHRLAKQVSSGLWKRVIDAMNAISRVERMESNARSAAMAAAAAAVAVAAGNSSAVSAVASTRNSCTGQGVMDDHAHAPASLRDKRSSNGTHPHGRSARSTASGGLAASEAGNSILSGGKSRGVVEFADFLADGPGGILRGGPVRSGLSMLLPSAHAFKTTVTTLAVGGAITGRDMDAASEMGSLLEGAGSGDIPSRVVGLVCPAASMLVMVSVRKEVYRRAMAMQVQYMHACVLYPYQHGIVQVSCMHTTWVLSQHCQLTSSWGRGSLSVVHSPSHKGQRLCSNRMLVFVLHMVHACQAHPTSWAPAQDFHSMHPAMQHPSMHAGLPGHGACCGCLLPHALPAPHPTQGAVPPGATHE